MDQDHTCLTYTEGGIAIVHLLCGLYLRYIMFSISGKAIEFCTQICGLPDHGMLIHLDNGI